MEGNGNKTMTIQRIAPPVKGKQKSTGIREATSRDKKAEWRRKTDR